MYKCSVDLLFKNDNNEERSTSERARNKHAIFFGGLDECSTVEFKNFVETLNVLVIDEDDKSGAVFDEFGNALGSKYDLGANGAYGRFKVLIGNFCSVAHEFGYNMLQNTIIAECMVTKAFQYKYTEDEDEFVRELQNYDVAWIFSGPTVKIVNNSMVDNTSINPDFVTQVVNFHNAGKGLFIWAENFPFVKHANAILPSIFNGQVKLINNLECGANLKGSKVWPLAEGTFSQNHQIMTNVNLLYEGYTISYPDTTLPAMKVIAVNSENKPVIFTKEKTVNSNQGRVIVDCGYTKVRQGKWNDTPATKRYVNNAAIWLVNDDAVF